MNGHQHDENDLSFFSLLFAFVSSQCALEMCFNKNK